MIKHSRHSSFERLALAMLLLTLWFAPAFAETTSVAPPQAPPPKAKLATEQPKAAADAWLTAEPPAAGKPAPVRTRSLNLNDPMREEPAVSGGDLGRAPVAPAE